MTKPSTVMFNKVTIKGAKQAVQMFGPAQHAVAKAVADSVADGIDPRGGSRRPLHLRRRLHPLGGEDDKKIQEYNYQATKEAIERAVAGKPNSSRGGRATQHRQASVRSSISAQPYSPGRAGALLARFLFALELRSLPGEAGEEAFALTGLSSPRQ